MANKANEFRAGLIQLNGRPREWAIFINDDWKVNRKLTLNIGLPYDRYGSQTDRSAGLRNLQFGAGSTFTERLANARLDYVGELFPTDTLNFAPGLGFAWDPAGRGKAHRARRIRYRV